MCVDTVQGYTHTHTHTHMHTHTHTHTQASVCTVICQLIRSPEIEYKNKFRLTQTNVTFNVTILVFQDGLQWEPFKHTVTTN